MAVNKNFVVKNGLEVDTNTLFVDSVNNRVAIGTTVPTVTLDVRGKIQSDSEIETWNAKVVGIITAGAVGVTTFTALDATVTGFSTLGRANATSLNVTSGFTTVRALSSVDLTVSIGATISKDLNVGAAATVGAALTVTGASKFAQFVRFEKDITVGAAATVGAALTVTGASKFAEFVRLEKDLTVGAAVTVGAALTVTGASKFAQFVRFEKDIAVGAAATVGVLTVTNNTYIGGNLVVAGDINLDEFNGRNLNVTGIATIGFLTASNAYISGVTTAVTFSGTTATIGFVTATNSFTSGVGTVINLVSTNANVSGVATVGFITASNTFVAGVSTAGFLAASNSSVSGVSTVGSLSVGATQVISSGRQLQNIASLDATTTSTIESAIANAPNTFTDLRVSGVSTFIGIATFASGLQVASGIATIPDLVNTLLNVSGVATVGFLTATNAYVSGVTTAITFNANTATVGFVTATNAFISGVTTAPDLISNRLNVSGITTVGSLNIGATQIVSSGRQLQNIASLDATTTATIESAIQNAPNNFNDLNVTGISTFTVGPVLIGSGTSTGTATQRLQVTGGGYVSGNLGIGTTNPQSKLDTIGDVLVTGNIRVTGVATVGFLTATNSFTSGVGTIRNFISTFTNVTGIATVGFLTASNAFVPGITTTSTLNVGLGGTVVTALGVGNSGRVGINSTSPAYVLDVDGDINTSTAVRINGVDILSTATGDATALAIALG